MVLGKPAKDNRQEGVHGPCRLTRHLIHVAPTQRLAGMLSSALLLLLVALIHNNNLLYFFVFWLVSVFFASAFAAYGGLSGLVVQVGQAQPVFTGENAVFTVTLTNVRKSRAPVRLLLMSDMATSVCLEKDQTQILTLPTPTQQRGWSTIPKLTLVCDYPFGMFRAWSVVQFDNQVLVYPRPEPTAILPISRSQRSYWGGHDELSEIRAYRFGDSPQRIYWRAYASGQGLQSRVYAEDDNILMLSLAGAYGNTLEEQLCVLCQWVRAAERGGYRYGLQLPAVSLPPDRGARHYADCLKSLALYGSGS